MNPTSLFELMHSSVVDLTQQAQEPPVEQVKSELFTDDVLALITYEKFISQMGRAYKFARWQGISPLATSLYRTLRDQHHTQRRNAVMTVVWANKKQRQEAIRDTRAYIAHIQKLKNSSNTKIRHIDAVQNYLAKTDCQLERLVRGLEDSI